MTKRDRAFLYTSVGALLLLIAGGWALRTWWWTMRMPMATGTVVEHRFAGGSGVDEPKRFAEGVDYLAADGKTYRFVSRATEQPLPIGTSVQVYYDPESPKEAEIASARKLWAPIGWFALTAALFTLFQGIRLRIYWDQDSDD